MSSSSLVTAWSMQQRNWAVNPFKRLSNGKFNDVFHGKMPSLALVTTSGYDSIVTDSANSMSAYMTGNKSVVNAMGVYENRTKDPLDDPKVETAAEILSRSKKMSYGMVTTAAVTDATPAAVTAIRVDVGTNYIAADSSVAEIRQKWSWAVGHSSSFRCRRPVPNARMTVT